MAEFSGLNKNGALSSFSIPALKVTKTSWLIGLVKQLKRKRNKILTDAHLN